MSDGPETVWERLRYRYEWTLYGLGARFPFGFIRNRSYRRFHEYLTKREVVVPSADGAKWRVYQLDGRIRYVAKNLHARFYDYAEWIGGERRDRYAATAGAIVSGRPEFSAAARNQVADLRNSG